MNRKSMPLLAMENAIGGIFFLDVRIWNEFAPWHAYASHNSRQP